MSRYRCSVLLLLFMCISWCVSCAGVGEGYEGSRLQQNAEVVEGVQHLYEAGTLAIGVVVHFAQANSFHEVRAANTEVMMEVFKSASYDGKPIDQIVLVADRHLLYLKKASYQPVASDLRYLYLFADKRIEPSIPLTTQSGEVYVSQLGLAVLSRRIEGRDSFFDTLLNAITGKQSYPAGDSGSVGGSHGH